MHWAGQCLLGFARQGFLNTHGKLSIDDESTPSRHKPPVRVNVNVIVNESVQLNHSAYLQLRLLFGDKRLPAESQHHSTSERAGYGCFVDG